MMMIVMTIYDCNDGNNYDHQVTTMIIIVWCRWQSVSPLKMSTVTPFIIMITTYDGNDKDDDDTAFKMGTAMLLMILMIMMTTYNLQWRWWWHWRQSVHTYVCLENEHDNIGVRRQSVRTYAMMMSQSVSTYVSDDDEAVSQYVRMQWW